jgi:hypothetical protein
LSKEDKVLSEKRTGVAGARYSNEAVGMIVVVEIEALDVASDDPTILTVKHWTRLLDGALYAASSRIEWAVLLQRTYGVDAFRCPRCTSPMRVMSTLVEPFVVQKILAHLGLPTAPLPRGRARDPTGQESLDFDAA